MKITVRKASRCSGGPVAGTCPHCGRDVIFNLTPAQDLLIPPNYLLGQRVCANPKCHGHVFFITENNELIELFPPSKIKFNSESVPAAIKESLDEAINCYAHKDFCAAAVMIRRAIDHICKDRGAKGKFLYDRIEVLKEKVILPPDFFKGMQNLRMLGNDAAHTEWKDFDEIGENEVKAGIEFAKKITEAIYQYKDLLAKLEDLKKK